MTHAGARLRRTVAVGLLVFAAAGLAAGCSGEERLDAAAFCDEFSAIGSSAQGSADGIATGLEDLAPRAPTAELGDAVGRVAGVFAAMATVERDGGDVGAELARQGEDPEVIEAVGLFSDFLTGECGLSLDIPTGGAATPDASAPEGAGAAE